jgi:hypothetical protein
MTELINPSRIYNKKLSNLHLWRYVKAIFLVRHMSVSNRIIHAAIISQ